jgi:hypothetical protein
VKELLDYMRARGFVVGEQAVFFRNGLCFLVNGAFLEEWHLRTLATYESCKDEDAKPDGLAIEYMAKGCLQIAEHPSINSLEADEGRDLFRRFEEWKNPELDVPVAQLQVLSKRMAYFLTRNFGYLWPETVPDHTGSWRSLSASV